MPTPNVSIVDLVLQVEKKTFAEEVNDAFRTYASARSQHPASCTLLMCFCMGSPCS